MATAKAKAKVKLSQMVQFDKHFTIIILADMVSRAKHLGEGDCREIRFSRDWEQPMDN